MSNLPEKEVYISELKAAGFTDIQVCYFANISSCSCCCFLFAILFVNDRELFIMHQSIPAVPIPPPPG